jgi:(1->4)-alpha-D-glucan 1-alpha-D-glucosylmutase
MADFVPFAEEIAQRGMIFSLAQAVLRLTSPGIPDLYQGNEIWDFSLVDPDNRRPVDFDLRIKLLAGLDSRSPKNLWELRKDGGIKMQAIRALLNCRRDFPDLFLKGDYIPLMPVGQHADQIVAFLRREGSKELLVVVPRQLGTGEAFHPAAICKDVRIPLPEKRKWKNVLTGSLLEGNDESIGVADLFCEWPVAVFLSQ